MNKQIHTSRLFFGLALIFLAGCSWVSGSIETTDLSLKTSPTTGTTYQSVSPLFEFKASNLTLPSAMTLTRASTGTYCDSTGNLVTAAINTPRFDYDCNTLALKGLLIEPSATNYVTRAEAFNSGLWVQNFTMSVTTDATTAPDGATTAELLNDTDGANVSFSSFAKTTGVGNTDEYVASVFMKQGTSPSPMLSLWFLNGGTAKQYQTVVTWTTVDSVGPTCNGGAGTCGYIKYPNGWYRIWSRGQNNGTGNTEVRNSIAFVAPFPASTGSVYLWGGQLERGWVPTSYITTSVGTVTRSADNLLVTPTSTLSTSWALVMNFSKPVYELAISASSFRLFDFYSSVSPTTLTTSASYNAVSTKIDLLQNGSGTASVSSASTPSVANQSYTLIASQQPASTSLKFDSDTTSSLSQTSTLTPNRLAIFGTSSNTQSTGHLKELRIYDQIDTSQQTPN